MSTTVDVNIKVTGAKKAASEVGDVADKADQGNEAISGMTGALDRMTGGMVSGFQGMVKGLKAGVKGFKSLKAALISTGIGALVVVIGSLVSYFTQTKRGAEELEKASAALGAVFAILTDRLSGLGELMTKVFDDPLGSIMELANSIQNFLINKIKQLIEGFGLLGSSIAAVFRGDFSEAADLAADGLLKVGDSFLALNPMTAIAYQITDALIDMAPAAQEAAKAAFELAKRSIALRDSQRKLKVAFAEGRAQIKEYNLIAEDTTKGLNERMEAAENAIEIEKGLMSERQRIASEELAIAKEKAALSETTEEDLNAISDLEVELINIRTESAELQTTLNNKLNTIQAQSAAEAKRLDDEEAARYLEKEERRKMLLEATQTAQENEIDAVVAQYEKLYTLAEEFGYSEEELADRQRLAIKAINDKYNDQELAATKKTEDEKLQARHQSIQQAMSMAQSMASFLLALNNSSDKKDEEQQKKAFNRGKALQLAGAAMSTASAIISALAAPPVGLGPVAGIPSAIMAGLAGAAQAVTISRQKFNSGSTGGANTGSVSSPSVATADMTEALVPTTFADSVTAPTPRSPGINAPVQAFVVSSAVTNQQQLDAQITHQSSL